MFSSRVSAYLQSQFSNSVHFVTFSHKLERVATSGDPLGILYKRKLQTLYRSEAVYALICSGKSLSSLSLSLSSLFIALLLCYFYCCYYYCDYYCCYEYFTVKGLYKTVTKLLSLFLLSSLPMLLMAVCGAGDLAHAVSVERFCLLLSSPLLLMAVCGAGDLAHAVSVARFCLLLSFHLLLMAVCGAGDLAHTVSVARFCLLLSFHLLLMAVCGAGDLAHTVSVARFCLLLSFSLLLTAVCGAGDLAHTVPVALFLDNTFFSFSFYGHWLVMCANTAVVLLPLGISAINYPPITLLQEDIHSLGMICF